VSGSSDNAIRVWDATTGSMVSEILGHIGPVLSVFFSPDGSQIASGSTDTTVRVWDVETASGAESMLVMQGHTSAVHCVLFSPDGQTIVSGSDDATIRVWETISGANRLPAL
jgi:WD40 repeat protein